MAISPAEPKGITPFHSDLSLVTTVSALRGEQKRTEIVVREALAKAQETCLALTTEIAALKAEIVILRGRLETAEGIHAASIRSKDVQIAALQAREAEFEAKKADDEAKKAKVVQAIIIAASKVPPTAVPTISIGGTGMLHRFRVFKDEIMTILDGYFAKPLKDL